MFVGTRSFVLLGVVMLSLAGLTAIGHSALNPSAKTSAAAPLGSTRPLGPGGNSASRYVEKVADDIHQVTDSAQQFQTGLAIFVRAQPVSPAYDDSPLRPLIDDVRSSISNARLDLAGHTSDAPSDLRDVQGGLLSGARELEDSFGTFEQFVGDRNPTTMSTFEEQYSHGIADWNGAVTTLYARAHEKAPTLPS